MYSTLLQTKLLIPPHNTRHINRPRLVQLMQTCLQDGRKLALVSAQAGCGKTTLLMAWINQLDRQKVRISWLSLNEDDDTLLRFWRYVHAALQVQNPESISETALFPEFMQLPATPTISWLASFLTPLLNACAALENLTVLILDDFHYITDALVLQSVAFFLQNLPPQLRLVLATRIDPAIPLAQLRARDQLVDVRAADLRFLDEEADQFFRTMLPAALDHQNLVSLNKRAEGWAAGLQLAALALRDQVDVAKFVEKFNGEKFYILDYLSQEVLEHLPGEVQEFLLGTAILDQFNADLCQAVLADMQFSVPVAQILFDLQKANLFLIALDDEHHWYRYHHLFADLLRARLMRKPVTYIAGLHRNASLWYEVHGLEAAAVHHALMAEDFIRAIMLIKRYVPHMWANSDMAYLRWLDQIPAHLTETEPALLAYLAWSAVLAGDLPRAQVLLQKSETCLAEATAEGATDILVFLAVLRVYLANFSGNAQAIIAPARQALAQLPETALAMRNTVEYMLGYAHFMQADFSTARLSFQALIARDHQHGTTNAIPLAVAKLAQICGLEGRLQENLARSETEIAYAEEQGIWRFYCAGLLYFARGLTRRQMNDLAGAEADFIHADALNQSWQVPYTGILTAIQLVRVYLATNRLADAQKTLARVESMLKQPFIMPDSKLGVNHVRMQVWLASGDLHTARQWALAFEQQQQSINLINEMDWIAYVRWLLAEQAWEKARAVSEKLIITVASAGRHGTVLEARWLQTMACFKAGMHDEALKTLGQMLPHAQQEGYVRLFLDGHDMGRDVLQAYLTQKNPPHGLFVKQLLAIFTAGTPAANKQRDLVEPLTPREREVLQLLCAGFSNQQIAEKLFLTLHTVKKHTSNIYQKLGVESRAQAMIKAQTLDLSG